MLELDDVLTPRKTRVSRVRFDAFVRRTAQHSVAFELLLIFLSPASPQASEELESFVLERLVGGGRQHRSLNHHHSPAGVLCGASLAKKGQQAASRKQTVKKNERK